MLAQRPPAVAAWSPRLLYPPRLGQCLTLALLLHILLVLVVGSAPGGSARPGEGVLGRINVTLRGPGPESASTEPPRSVGPTGHADTPRYGGRVQARTTPPRPPQDAGAAELGRYSATQQLKTLGSGPSESGQVAPLGTLPQTAPAAVAPQVLSRTMPPAPTRLATFSAADMPTLTAPRQVPLNTVPAPATLVSARLPPTPVRLSTLTAPTSGVAPSAAAPLSTLATTVVNPNELSEPLPPAPVRTATLSAPSSPATQVAPPAAPLAPARSIEPAPDVTSLPPLQVPTAATAATAPAASTTPAATPTAPTAPRAATEASTSPSASSTPPSSTQAAAPGAPQRPATGAPDAGARVGHDLAVAPTSPASAPLNLTLPGFMHGGELAPRSYTGMLPMLPQPADRKTKLERAVDSAGKSDCRKAYAGAGLLAVVPLAIDTVRGKGCAW